MYSSLCKYNERNQNISPIMLCYVTKKIWRVKTFMKYFPSKHPKCINIFTKGKFFKCFPFVAQTEIQFHHAAWKKAKNFSHQSKNVWRARLTAAKITGKFYEQFHLLRKYLLCGPLHYYYAAMTRKDVKKPQRLIALN